MEIESNVEELKELVRHYKFASESFEKRVLDLQKELASKDEEIKLWKDKYETGLAARKDASTPNLEEGEEPLSMRKLFIGGLPQEANGKTLEEHFASYGTVHDAMVVKDNVTQKSRGFGFVVFTHSYMTDIAQAARPHKILGKEVDTKRAIPKSTIEAGLLPKNPHIQSRRVFIGGLRQSTTPEMIKDYFTRFGEVLTVDLIEDLANGKSRGFAYVTFTDSDSTDKVVVQKFHTIDSRKCEAKPAFHKLPKGSFQDQQHPPSFNPHYHEFQTLFGALQQQQQHYYNNSGAGCNHHKGPQHANGSGDKDEADKCHHCDNVPTDAEAWNAAALSAAAASGYMNLDANYQAQYRNYYYNNTTAANNNATTDPATTTTNNNNYRHAKSKAIYFQKPKPY